MARGGNALGVAMSQEELESLTLSGSLTVGGGASLGNAAADLVGFHGSTAVQGSALTLVGTSIPVAACASFGLTSTQLTAIVTALNSLITMAQAKGLHT
jgi:hypothetical protein